MLAGVLRQTVRATATANTATVRRATLETKTRMTAMLAPSVRLYATADDFATAQKTVTSLRDDPGNAAKLKLYALFKQATDGANTQPKPGMLDFVKKAKWDAWSALGQMSKDDAMAAYTSYVAELAAEIGVRDAAPSADAKSTRAAAADTNTSADTQILRRIDGKIFNIHLNRPDKMNAITQEMYERWAALLREASDHPDTSITVISASGPFYCGGNDLSMFTKDMSDPMKMAADGKVLMCDFVSAFIDHAKPLVGLVHGPAVGISVTTLGLCDVVYCADHATFHTPFVALGQGPEGCSSLVFPRIMGSTKANEMILFGKKLSAQEAFDRNLVCGVFPKATFEEEAWALVRQYSELPPLSMKYAKETMRNVLREYLHKVNLAEGERLQERWTSEECMQAIMNFFQQQQAKKKAKM